MADPRADALLRALSGGGMGGMHQMPGGEMMEGPEEMMGGGEDPLKDTVSQVLAALEPFMEDPRIAQAASALQEVVAGPEEMPSDSLPEEAAEPMPQ